MFSSQISSERSGAQQATEDLGQEFLDKISPEEHIAERHADAILNSSRPNGKMAHPSHRWTYKDGTLVDEPSRTTSSSSSYSLREIVPEREPISDDKLVEGPEMAPGIGLGTSIEEDPSEPKSNLQMTPEPERVAPAATGDMRIFVADSLPLTASPTPIPPVKSVYSFPALPSLPRGGAREH
ncbi:hypothetical protein M9H77_16810 [Catharanthus roseus]|uniref:Uncharacterized protein n=1 Tax=Catharanthus roseus TaxID=4058 RepID=A0ACC0B2S8_CATRO|nr:hypothetical protein M9H77_16810 [Catharanthus roseus]